MAVGLGERAKACGKHVGEANGGKRAARESLPQQWHNAESVYKSEQAGAARRRAWQGAAGGQGEDKERMHGASVAVGPREAPHLR
jgi:hypothetical protein